MISVIALFTCCLLALTQATAYAQWFGELKHYAIESHGSVVVCIDSFLPSSNLFLRIYATDHRRHRTKVPIMNITQLDISVPMSRPRKCFRIDFKIPTLKYRKRWMLKQRLFFGLYRRRFFWFSKRLDHSRHLFTIKNERIAPGAQQTRFTQQLDAKLSRALELIQMDDLICLKAAGAKIPTPVDADFNGYLYALQQTPVVFERLMKVPWSTTELNEMLWTALDTEIMADSRYMDMIVTAGADVKSLELDILNLMERRKYAEKDDQLPPVVLQVQRWVKEGQLDQGKLEEALRQAFEADSVVWVRALLGAKVNAPWMDDSSLRSSSPAMFNAFWDNDIRFEKRADLRNMMSRCMRHSNMGCVTRLINVFQYQQLNRQERRQYQHWLKTALERKGWSIFDQLAQALPPQERHLWQQRRQRSHEQE